MAHTAPSIEHRKLPRQWISWELTMHCECWRNSPQTLCWTVHLPFRHGWLPIHNKWQSRNKVNCEGTCQHWRDRDRGTEGYMQQQHRQRETFGRQSHVPPCLTHWVSAEECSNVATKLHCFRDAGNHHHGWAQHKSALFQICRKLPWLVWVEMCCLTTGRLKCLKDFDQ